MTGEEFRSAVRRTGLLIGQFATLCGMDRKTLSSRFASPIVDVSFLEKVNPVALQFGVDLLQEEKIKFIQQKGPSLALMKTMNEALANEIKSLKETIDGLRAHIKDVSAERDTYKRIVENGINNFKLRDTGITLLKE